MSRSRSQRIADFENRSVQLIAACTLGLAGMASAQMASPVRHAGHASAMFSATSRSTDIPRPARLNYDDVTSVSPTRR